MNMMCYYVLVKGVLLMKYHAPMKCPVCGDTMELTRLRCGRCSTELTGSFEPCRFCALEDRHTLFIETFLRCRGSIKEVEKALGVSYPTVKNMLEAALEALGLEDGRNKANERGEILESLSGGEIDVEAAVEKLRRIR